MGSLLGAALLLLAAGSVSAPPPPAAPTPAADPRRGERLFASDCAGCHGRQGEGGVGPALAVPRLARAPDDEALVKVIKQGVDGTEMPGAAREPEEIRHLAAWVRKLGQRPAEKVPGDPGRGEALYFGKGACATCHGIRGRGGSLGPDLTDIGLRRGAAHLRAALIEPEAAVPRSFSPYRQDISLSQNFLQVRVVTRAGAAITGVRINEDSFSIQLRDATRRVYSFFKSELRELHKDWGRSPMPSYQPVFSGAELDDLVAFLLALRGDQP